MNIKNYEYKWSNIDWFADPAGSTEVKKKLDDLKKYLTFEKKQSMSRYEVRLYEWILKKQYKADPIELIEWIEIIDPITYNTHRQIGERKYYLGYYNPACNYHPEYQDIKYEKEQQKLRSRFHSKMGR